MNQKYVIFKTKGDIVWSSKYGYKISHPFFLK